jgi:transcriptional regulator with XRE-family HTH domain
MAHDLWVSVGKRIAEARQAENLKLEELAELTGINANCLKQFESDSRGLNLEQLINIALFVKRDIMWFFEGPTPQQSFVQGARGGEAQTGKTLDYRENPQIWDEESNR